jgi:hypothetical protein
VEIYFCLNPSAVCGQAAPTPLHITQINNVGIILECMFLKPLLKYLNKEFQKSKKVKRTTILSGLCHCYLNSKQTPATEVRLKRRETAPKQLSSVLCMGSCL